MPISEEKKIIFFGKHEREPLRLKDIGYQGTFNFETIAPAHAKNRPEFVYSGEVVRILEKLPISVWKMFNTSLYEMGKFMLESYGLYEE